LTEKIIGVFYEVYNELEFGFLESHLSMRIALGQAGLRMEIEVSVRVSFHGTTVRVFRADLVVETRGVLELKTADSIRVAHETQVLHYLRASSTEVGLVINFGPNPRFRRVEMGNDRKKRVSVDALWPSQGMGR
jgi:GxxExxY protein